VSADLRTITISDFRSIRGTAAVALNAPVVLLHGTNGAGKSTVMSALELSLTGRVSGLGAPDSEHLVHRGARSASIALLTDDRSIDFTVEGSHIHGTPLLATDDVRFFGERCYLQQRTLGRLLELYEEPREDGDSPLTVFVNDLLGLDELDALIDGLYPVTDKRRVKRLVRKYADLDRQTDGRREQIAGLLHDVKDVCAEADAAQARLEELLSALEAPPGLQSDLVRTGSWLKQGAGDEERALVDLIGARRELTALAKRADGLSKRAAAEEVAGIEDAAVAARAAADAWRSSHGAALEALLDELRRSLPQMPAGAADPASARAAALEQVSAELDRLKETLASNALANRQAEHLDQEAATTQRRLDGIDEQLAAAGTATEAEELGKVLATLVPHVHTNDCPVCGRDYSEISREPLSARLAAQVSALAVQAKRLQELATARLEGLSDIRRVENERNAVNRLRMAPEGRIDIETTVARLENDRHRLIELASGVKEGAALIRKQTETERDLTIAREQDLTWAELRAAVEIVAGSLARPANDPTPPIAAIAALATHVAERIAMLEERSTRRAAAVEIVGQLTSQLGAQRQLEAKIKAEQEAIDRGDAVIAEVERRRSVARKLRDEAEAARVRIVRQVFTNSLNRVWRDLFVRLAPEEPFVPVFRVPDGNQRVVASLETMHRDGKPGGPPGAMLSAGNLNTAALTLFLALNLSVERRLPWILLDDPVQSMDEVHVAQFAALLRTLSSEHGRRVLIAVHERALFDYLALELSPANPDDSLVTVELSRAPDGSTSVESNFQPYVEDRTFEPA
jgi:exonuclease SbcC